MKVRELYNYLNNCFPTSLSCDWDNDGLMCSASGDAEVKKALITLDVSESAVNYAIQNNFNVIISHHPMIFRKLGSVTDGNYVSQKIISAIKNDISVMSFHTRLDAACGGVNDVLADLLGLQNVEAFGPEGEKMGRVGVIQGSMQLSDFAKKVKEVLKSPAVLLSGNKPVSKVALLGGDGKDFVGEAIAVGADTYVSGRISYNIMADASEMGINLIEAGHYYTEQPVCRMLLDKIQDEFPSLTLEIFESNNIEVI